jgi:protein involved in polysaccharide export with SLBB domain
MAGGIDPRGYGRNVEVWRVDRNTSWRVVNVDLALPAEDPKGPAFELQNGDLLLVRPVLEKPANTVEVAGAVRRPGEYEVPAEGLDVRGLLQKAEGPDDYAYMKSAVIWRLTPAREQRLLRLDLLKAIQGDASDNLRLESGDRLYVYSREEVMQSQEVSVSGAVASPGIFPWAGDMRVSDLLLLGRGLLDGAHVGRADLRRLTSQLTREIVPVSLGRVLAGDVEADLALEPGDQLTVYRQTEMGVAAEVVVLGSVLRPGVYPRAAGMKASDLIAQAGGLLPDAGKEATLVKGRTTGAPQTTALELVRQPGGPATLNPDPELADDDSLTVIGTGGFQVRAQVAVIQGLVSQPGTYPLLATADKPDTVYQLITRAGGLLPNGNPRGIILYRLRDSLLGPDQTDDLNQVLTGFNRERAPDEPDMSTSARSASLSSNVTTQLASVLTTQDGVTIVVPPRTLTADVWARAVPIDGRTLMDSKGAEGDMPLMQGDTVVVPATSTTVAVIGAVVRPGAVSYDGPKTALAYVAAAGGPTADAAPRRVVVVRANGSVSAARETAEVFPGDIVVVPSNALVRQVSTDSGASRLLRTLASVTLGYLLR